MKQHALVIFAVLLVSACGDDNENRQPVGDSRTGVFGPGVSGVRYTTSTQSGLTDERGTFTYAAGETVAFTLGGIALGSAAGADTVNVFEVQGTTAPTDAERMLRELRDSFTQPFERALNVAMFLMSIDADGNPTNGIDLTGRDDELVNAHVDFGRTFWQFESDASYIAARIPRYALHAFTREVVVAYVYRAAGATLSGRAVRRIDYDRDSDNTLDSYVSATFDTNGLAVQLTYGRNDLIDAQEERVRDGGQRMTRLSRLSDQNDGGTFDTTAHTDYAYAANGTLTSVMRDESDAIDSFTTTYTYDASGRLTRIGTQITPTLADAQVFTWDVEAHTLTTTWITEDSGVTTPHERAVYVYDNAGRLASYNYERLDGDGRTTAETYTYDANGNLLTRDRTDDGRRSVESYTYDGRTTTRYESVDYGTGDTVSAREVSDYTYESGQVTRELLTRTTGDMSYVGREVVWTYDANGHLLTASSRYYDSESSLYGGNTETYTLDPDGTPTKLVTTFVDGDSNTQLYSLESTANPVASTLALEARVE